MSQLQLDHTKQSSHSQILRSSAIIGGASVINILISLIRMKVVAVLLGPAGVGLIGILQNLMATAATASSLGFGNVGTRQIAEANGRGSQPDIDAARRALFWGTMTLAFLGGIVFWFLKGRIAESVLNDASLGFTAGWLAFGVALTVATSSQQALLAGMRRIGDIARVSVMSSLLSTALGVPLIFWLENEGAVWFVIASPLATFIISYVFVARLPSVQAGPTPIRILCGQWRTMARLGSAFMVAGIVLTLGQLVVRTLIQNEVGAEELGYFQAAWAISMTYIGFVLSAMGMDYYPRLTAVINDHEKVNRLVNEQTEVAILLAGPVLLGMLALAPWVIQLLYSAEFAPAVTVLRWQILGDALKIMSWPLGFVILAAGAGKTYVIAESAGVSAFVFVTWLIVPTLGVEGAGISFLVMYLVYLPIVFWLVRRRTGFQWSWSVIRNFLVLMLFAILTFSISSWDQFSGMLVGLFLALGFGFMTIRILVRSSKINETVDKVIKIFR